jgi:predicted RNase H-like HicB family nuclease
MNKNVDYYLNLPYTFIVQPFRDESGCYYTGKVLELDGCMTDGDSKEEVIENLREAMEGWIETKLENGLIVPEPVEDSGFSGKFVLRLPKSLHARLSMEAEREGVSLNQYALYKLAK